MTIKMKVQGMEKTSRKMRRLKRDYPRAFNMSMFAEAIHIMRLSQPKVPVLTGDLKRSAALTKTPNWSALQFNVFGAYTVHYAKFVHNNHRTKAGFLSQAINESRSGQNRRISKMTHKMAQSGVLKVPKHEFKKNLVV